MRNVCSLLVVAGLLCAATADPAKGGAFDTPSLLGMPQSGPSQDMWQTASEGPTQLSAAPSIDGPPQPVSLGSETFDEALSGGSCGGGSSCGSDFGYGACGPACGSCFYGRVSGLVMGRDEPDEVWLSFFSDDANSAVLGSRDARSDFRGGVEATIGWHVGCNERIEMTYWTLDASHASSQITNTTRELSTPLNLGTLTLNGLPLTGYFDNAWEHRVERRNEFHNVEINWLYSPCCGCGSFRLTGLAGIRFFRFDEGLLFGAASQGFLFNADPTEEAYYDVDVENNLVGIQVGGNAEYFVTPCLSLFAAPKVGVYNNHIRHRAQIYRGDNAFSALDVHSSRNDVAMLAQLDLGLNYRITNCWSVYGGYRIVAASGLALADDQIPQFLQDTNSARTIDAAGSLLLHGGFAGLECRF